MDGGLGLGQPSERLHGAVLNVRRQCATVQDGLDVAQTAMLRAWIMHAHMELCTGDALLCHFFDGELIAWNLQRCQLRSQSFEVRPGIDQCPDRHIAANPGKTVQVCGSHGQPRVSYSPSRLMIWAM